MLTTIMCQLQLLSSDDAKVSDPDNHLTSALKKHTRALNMIRDTLEFVATRTSANGEIFLRYPMILSLATLRL